MWYIKVEELVKKIHRNKHSLSEKSKKNMTLPKVWQFTIIQPPSKKKRTNTQLFLHFPPHGEFNSPSFIVYQTEPHYLHCSCSSWQHRTVNSSSSPPGLCFSFFHSSHTSPTITILITDNYHLRLCRPLTTAAFILIPAKIRMQWAEIRKNRKEATSFSKKREINSFFSGARKLEPSLSWKGKNPHKLLSIIVCPSLNALDA